MMWPYWAISLKEQLETLYTKLKGTYTKLKGTFTKENTGCIRQLGESWYFPHI